MMKQEEGDIDILILCPEVLNWEEKHHIRITFFKQFGEQKLDILSFSTHVEHPMKKIALQKAIQL